ncbi:MAG: hypothetical protein OEZ29_04495 [Candidatus Bathyarchaeota archaeon]|nr:hypothetical protein [Candidatus Bathyarchaeota archaeon]MDH5779836.1 hypothetical protein [Candidatus Bathyarchaeota archaeon]
MNLKDLMQPKMLTPLIIGAIIRFAIAPLTEHRWDLYIWRLHQVFVYHYHVNPFWPQNIPKIFCWSYPPLWLFILLLMYPIFAVVSPTAYPNDISSLWNPPTLNTHWSSLEDMFESYRRFAPPFVPVNLPLLDFIIKAPIIVADILIAILLYKMIKAHSNESNARYAYWAWLLNPFTICISALWGMFDPIPILFVLLALHYFLNQKYGKSALLLGVAISLKMYAILLIPIFAFVIFKRNKKVLGAIKYLLISAGFTLLMVFPTFYVSALASGQEPLSLSTELTLNLFIKRASPDWRGQNMMAGLTPLVALDNVIGRNSEILNFNVPLSPILMTLGLILILAKMYRKKKLSTGDVISYTAVTHFMIYLTYSIVNIPHLAWVLPLLLIVGAEKGSLLPRYFYWIISAIGILALAATADLSYFISPYLIPGDYLKWYVLPRIPISDVTMGLLGVGIGLLYFAGIAFVLRKS